MSGNRVKKRRSEHNIEFEKRSFREGSVTSWFEKWGKVELENVYLTDQQVSKGPSLPSAVFENYFAFVSGQSRNAQMIKWSLCTSTQPPTLNSLTISFMMKN